MDLMPPPDPFDFTDDEDDAVADDDVSTDDEALDEAPLAPPAPPTSSAFPRPPQPVALAAPAPQPGGLLRLPPELLCRAAGWLGPRCSNRDRGWSAIEFFAACRQLYALSKDALLRSSFLVGSFGAQDAVLGIGFWLGLASPEVFTAVASVATSSGTVPRFLLQRLIRRLGTTGRTDLLPAAASLLNELYPAGPVSRQPRDYLSQTDDELMRAMIRDPRCVVPELVLDAVAGGWAVEDDPVLSSLLTLKHKYGLRPSVPPGGLSSAAVKATGHRSTRRMYLYAEAPQTKLVKDLLVPGLDANHDLLLECVRRKEVRNVERLLRFGVSTSAADHRHGWLWDAAREIGLWDDSATVVAQAADPDLAAAPDRERRRRRTLALSYILGPSFSPDGTAPFSAAPPHLQPGDAVPGWKLERLIRAHHSASPSPSYHSDEALIGDAAEAALRTRDPGMARLLLGHEHEARDRWRTAEGDAMLARWQKALADSIELYVIVSSYRVGCERDRSVDLLAAIVQNNEAVAKSLVDDGIALTVSQMVSILGNNILGAPVHTLAIRLVPLQPKQIEEVLGLLLNQRHIHPFAPLFPPFDGPADADHHPGATLLLRAYQALWAKPLARAMLLRLFSGEREGRSSSNDCTRRALRPYLGERSEHAATSAVLRWDLYHAIRTDDVETARELIGLGVRRTESFIHAWYLPGMSDAMARLLLDSGAAPSRGHAASLRSAVSRGNATVAMMIVEECGRRGADAAVQRPDIVRACVPHRPPREEHAAGLLGVFRRALEVFGEGSGDEGLLRMCARAAGEAWVGVLDAHVARRVEASGAIEVAAVVEGGLPAYPTAELPQLEGFAADAL
ncbi:hypothetical protein DFJ74DRAFT_709954 [Hyaloraphidium curvatum]|nr:hypothetical protein DFJ74DRAFT_709954 [Hyaloraphidium curvatum]